MNRYRLRRRYSVRAQSDPIGHTAKRLASWLVIAAALGGLVVASLLDAAGVPTVVALAIGLMPFVGAAAFATNVAVQDGGGASSAEDPVRNWARASQLGPDPQQLEGRRTGART